MNHGHVSPNEDGSKARCGGPGICAECSREAAQATKERKEPAPGSDTPMTDAAQVAGNIKNQSDTDKEWPWSAISRGYDFARTLERENTALRSKMTEAWKLVHAMSGQEYWDRAEQWLDENKEFKPEGFVG